MWRRGLIVVLAIVSAGCGQLQPVVPDTAEIRPGQLGAGLDPDVSAVNLAQWAYADPSRTYGRPVEAARAAASIDYIAGRFYTSPRWSNVSALTKEQLLQGRLEVRQVLGVPESTPSQVVVDRLTAAGNALAAGDQPTAVRELGPPTFSPSGDQVLTRLNNMPYLRMANVATMQAANELFDANTGDWNR